MKEPILLLFLLFVFTPINCVLLKEAFQVDWAKEQLGIFRKEYIEPVEELNKEADENVKINYISVWTESNILGTLDYKYGRIVWRYHFPQYNLLALKSFPTDNGGKLVTAFDISEVQGKYANLKKTSKLSSWFVTDGFLDWEVNFNGKIVEIEKYSDNSLVVLLENSVIYNVNLETGEIINSWTTENSKAVGFTRVENSVFLLKNNDKKIILSEIGADKKLKSISSSENSIILAKSFNKNNNILVFKKDQKIFASLNFNSPQQLLTNSNDDVIKGINYVQVSMSDSYVSFNFYITEKLYTSQIYHFHGSKSLGKPIIDSPDLSVVYKDGYIINQSANKNNNSKNLVIYNSNQKIVDSNSNLSLDLDFIYPVKGSLDLILISKDGVISLYSGSSDSSFVLSWSKKEYFADAQSSIFVDLIDKEVEETAHYLIEEEKLSVFSSYLNRVKRHWSDLFDFYDYLKASFKSYKASFNENYKNLDDSLSKLNDDSFESDTFGFRKYILLLTKQKSLIALDSLNYGREIWKVDLYNKIFDKTLFGPFIVHESHVFNSQKIDLSPVAVLIGSNGTMVKLSALTGELYLQEKIDLNTNEYIESILDFSINGLTTSDLTDDSNKESSETLCAWTCNNNVKVLYGDKDSLPEISYLNKQTSINTIQGYEYVPLKSDKLIPTWKFETPNPKFEIKTISYRNPLDVTASIARVVGNRNVLYKFIDKNIIAIAYFDYITFSIYITLLNTVSGRVLVTTHHSHKQEDILDISPSGNDIKLVVGENWIVYSYWSRLPSYGEKIVVWDLYESEEPNTRYSVLNVTKSLSFEEKKNFKLSAFHDIPSPFIASQSFICPWDFSAMGIVRTKFGITSKNIIAADSSGQILQIPRVYLDPRRPVRADYLKSDTPPGTNKKIKLSSEEIEEGLIVYDPLIPDISAENVLSHSRTILGTKKILTYPSNLESTSLIFTHGVDLFFTRATPSQPFDILPSNFNKFQLALVFFGLIIINLTLRPLIKRKLINLRWGYTP